MNSTRAMHEAGAKRVYYLSMEFLIGRLLRDALSNLELSEQANEALAAYGINLAQIEELEPDAALGNGGLGRLAACFMESLATLDLPACGYGLRYINGMFRQRIKDGWQLEYPETWLAHGNPWEFERRETSYLVGFGGEVISSISGAAHWQPAEAVRAEAVDTPVVGWHGKRVNTLRCGMRLRWIPIASMPSMRAIISAPWRKRRGPSGWCGFCIRRLQCRRPGIAAAAGVFFFQRLDPGHPAPPYAVFRRHQIPSAKGCNPAQRHASPAVAVAK